MGGFAKKRCFRTVALLHIEALDTHQLKSLRAAAVKTPLFVSFPYVCTKRRRF
jgi:hypothetical protein